MSQAPSVVSSPPSSPTQSLTPALQAALASLDVHLEEELARYRRQRAGRPMRPGIERTQTRKAIDLISLAPVENRNQQPISGMASATAMMFASKACHTANMETATSQELPQQTSHDATSSTDASELYTSTAGASPTLDAENTAGASVASTMASPQTRSAPLGGDLVYQGSIPDPPEDYLASSEQLLRSLAEEEAQIQRERTIRDNLLTPLGVGSMLLLLLSSATVGYIVMNPSTLGYLGFNRERKTPTVAQNTTQTATNTDNTTSLPAIISGPNLAEREFVNLNINNLSTVKTGDNESLTAMPFASPKPQPLSLDPTPSPVGNGSPQDLAEALLPPEIQPIPVQPKVVGPPPFKPATATPKQAPTAKKTPVASRSATKVGASFARLRQDFYYVLKNYDSDRTLAKVRQIVPDAYVVQFPKGARIQMAAFYTQSQAQTFVQELQKKGISAWVYHP